MAKRGRQKSIKFKKQSGVTPDDDSARKNTNEPQMIPRTPPQQTPIEADDANFYRPFGKNQDKTVAADLLKKLDAIDPLLRNDYLTKDLVRMAGLEVRLLNPADLIQKRGRDVRFYDQIMLDSVVMSSLEIKKRLVLSVQSEIVAGSDDPESQERAAFLNKMISCMETPIYDLDYQFLENKVYGYTVGEKVYGANQNEFPDKWILKNVKLIHPYLFDFDYDTYGNLYRLHIGYRVGVNRIVEGWDNIDNKFMIFAWPNTRFGNWYGSSVLNELYYDYYAKYNLIRFRDTFLQSFGRPVVNAVYNKKHMNAASKNNLHEMLQNWQDNYYFLTPANSENPDTGKLTGKDFEIELLEAKSTNTDAFEKAISYHDTAMKRRALIPDNLGFSDAKNAGTYAQSRVQFDIFLEDIKLHHKKIEDLWNPTLMKIEQMNFGPQKEYCKRKFKSIDNQLEWQMLQVLLQTGVIDKDEQWIRDHNNIPNLTPQQKSDLANKKLTDAKVAQQLNPAASVQPAPTATPSGGGVTKTSNGAAQSPAPTGELPDEIIIPGVTDGAKDAENQHDGKPELLPVQGDQLPDARYQPIGASDPLPNQNAQPTDYSDYPGYVSPVNNRDTNGINRNVRNTSVNSSTAPLPNTVNNPPPMNPKKQLSGAPKIYNKNASAVVNFKKIKTDLDTLEADFMDRYKKVRFAVDNKLVKAIKRKYDVSSRDYKWIDKLLINKSAIKNSNGLVVSIGLKNMFSAYLTKAYCQGKVSCIEDLSSRLKKAKEQFQAKGEVLVFSMDDDTEWLDNDEIKAYMQEHLEEYGDFAMLSREDVDEIKAIRQKAYVMTGEEEARILKGVSPILRGALDNETALSDVVDKIEGVLRDDREQYALTIARTNSAEYYNLGQEMVYKSDDVRPYIEGFQWSSILDDATTPYCESMDGLCWASDEEGAESPAHFNCRSIIVPIFIGDSEDKSNPFFEWGSDNEKIQSLAGLRGEDF